MTLPVPSPEAIALSDRLLSQIIDEIKAQGSISFSRFMQLALYAPGLGYYQNAYQKFGKEGDFVTAPEISSLFSYCIANHCATVLAELPDGDILEFGAGSGVMAADILCHLQKMKQLPSHYFIVELSATLQSQQRETIEKKAPFALDRVVWLSKLPENSIKGVVLANEILDAMPVNLFVVKDHEAAFTLSKNTITKKNELCVAINSENKLIFVTHEKTDDHYVAELNEFVQGWMKSLSALLSRGIGIIIDYGFLEHEYYHPDRSMGTLMCHYRHYMHADPFFYPGLQDITTHVNFTLAAESAEENGFSVTLMNQAEFLLQNNLLSFITAADGKSQILLNQQVLKLTSPNEMGELFKVLLLRK